VTSPSTSARALAEDDDEEDDEDEEEEDEDCCGSAGGVMVSQEMKSISLGERSSRLLVCGRGAVRDRYEER